MKSRQRKKRDLSYATVDHADMRGLDTTRHLFACGAASHKARASRIGDGGPKRRRRFSADRDRVLPLSRRC